MSGDDSQPSGADDSQEPSVSTILKRAVFPGSDGTDFTSRRRILAAIGTGLSAAGIGALSSRVPPHVDAFEDDLYYLQEIEWTNLDFWNNMIQLLWGAYTTDWAYRTEASFGDVNGTLSHLETGGKKGELNAFQGICPDEYVLSSPEDDHRFGLTERGRLSSMNDGLTHQIPYKVTSRERELDGALEREGGFFGIVTEGDVDWQFDGFDVVSGTVTDYGIAELEFRHDSLDLTVKQMGYVPFSSGSLRLDFDIQNGGDQPLSGEFLYYLQANANRNKQSPIVFHTEINEAESGEILTWRKADEAGDEGVKSLHLRLVDGDGQPANDSGVARAAIDDGDRSRVRNHIDDITTKRLTRYWLWPYFEGGIKEEQSEFPEGVEFKNLLDKASERTRGRYVSGYQSKTFEVDPDEVVRFTVVLSEDEDRARRVSTADGLETATRRKWNSWIEDLSLTDIHPGLRDFAEYQATVLAINWVPSAGAFVAAHHLQPSYYYVWPRDGIDVAIAAARVGLEDWATRFFEQFLPSVQEPNGMFKQAYMTDGTEANLYVIGHDQAAKFITGAFELNDIVTDDLVRELQEELLVAAESFVNDIASNELVQPAYDYKETPNQISQSLYVNVLAVRALRNLQERFDVEYSETVESLERGIREQFLRPESDEWYRALQGVVPRWRDDYTGMSSYMYTLDVVDETRYLEDLFEHVGVTDVEGTWTVATGHMAEAAAQNATDVFEIKGEQYTGSDLAHRRLRSNVEDASDHGILYEKIRDGNPSDARYLTWSAAEFLNAAKVLGSQ